MKTRIMLSAVFAAMLLLVSSCSKNANNPPREKIPALINLTLRGTATETKATGASLPTQLTENNVKRVAVGIFNSDGSVNIIKEFISIASTITLNCTPGSGCTGIVVANAPSGHFAGVTTKAAFEGKLVDLTQTSDELPMSGKIMESSNESFTLSAGSTTALTAQLSRLVARVAINSIATDFEPAGQYSNATFTLKKIFLHNANTKSTVAVTPVGSVPLTGKVDDVNTGLQDKLSPPVSITSSAYTTPYWFYTFAHDASTPTKLVIYGTFDPDGAGSASPSDVYYPVVINKAQAGTVISGNSGSVDSSIQPNNTYTITAVIKGKGVADPDTDINPAVLNLTVTVADWVLNITQNVTFN